MRFGGHAGTDVEAAYRTPAELRADAERDPIVGTARVLVASGWTHDGTAGSATTRSREMVYKVAADRGRGRS